jgi:L-threonylcarbamoyladenylate synthase
LVAFPTETVYGLGADATNPASLPRLYQAKGRPSSHPVIVHVACRAQALLWGSRIPPVALTLMEAFWPGPLTLIVPKAPHVLDSVTGGLLGVGLRCPAHPLALQLLQAQAQASQGKPCGVAAPSANRFGAISPTRIQHVLDGLGGYLDPDRDGVMDGGPCGVGIESTIVDFTGDRPKLLRPGGIGVEALRSVLGSSLQVSDDVWATDLSGQAPGTLASHYAPNTPLWLVSTQQLLATVPTGLEKRTGFLLYSGGALQAMGLDSPSQVVVMPTTPAAYAQQLYHQLQTLDTQGLERLWLEMPPLTEPWRGVWDRLLRAGRPLSSVPTVRRP